MPDEIKTKHYLVCLCYHVIWLRSQLMAFGLPHPLKPFGSTGVCVCVCVCESDSARKTCVTFKKVCADMVELKTEILFNRWLGGQGSEGLGSYCWLESKQAWAGKNVGREGIQDTNEFGVKGVDIYIVSALDLYIFMGLLFLVCALECNMAVGILICRRQCWIL